LKLFYFSFKIKAQIMAKTQPIQIGLSTQTHDHVMSLHNLSTTKTMRSTEPRPSPEWLSFIRIIPFLPLLYHILKALSSVFLIFFKRRGWYQSLLDCLYYTTMRAVCLVAECTKSGKIFCSLCLLTTGKKFGIIDFWPNSGRHARERPVSRFKALKCL
jgi:hypothetical protein